MILAHGGIQHPEIWEDWASLHEGIKLFALAPDSCRDHIPRLDVKLLPTEWGHKNIAINTLNGFRRVIETDPDVGIVYLVCGYSLPLQHPSYLFQGPFRLPELHANPGMLWDPMQSSIPVVNKTNDNFTECTQWISLTRDTILSLDHNPALLEDENETLHYPDEWYIQTLVDRGQHHYQDIPYMELCHTCATS